MGWGRQTVSQDARGNTFHSVGGRRVRQRGMGWTLANGRAEPGHRKRVVNVGPAAACPCDIRGEQVLELWATRASVGGGLDRRVCSQCSGHNTLSLCAVISFNPNYWS